MENKQGNKQIYQSYTNITLEVSGCGKVFDVLSAIGQMPLNKGSKLIKEQLVELLNVIKINSVKFNMSLGEPQPEEG